MSGPAAPAEAPSVTAAATAAPAEKEDAPSFTVFCRTADNVPVADAQIQVCTGSMCQMLKSDENGLITYYGMPGLSYDVTPIRAPKGFVLVSDRAVIASEKDQRIEFLFEKEKLGAGIRDSGLGIRVSGLGQG